MNENVPANQESTNQPSISVRNVANLGTFCFSLVKTVFMHFERPSVISRILLYFIQNVYFYTFHAHSAPFLRFYTFYLTPILYIYISSTRNSNVQFGKLTPRICSRESFSGSWEARRKGNHRVPGSSPLRLPAGCNWPIGSVMVSNCMLINTFMLFFLLSSLAFVFNYFRKKRNPVSWLES